MSEILYKFVQEACRRGTLQVWRDGVGGLRPAECTRSVQKSYFASAGMLNKIVQDSEALYKFMQEVGKVHCKCGGMELEA